MSVAADFARLAAAVTEDMGERETLLKALLTSLTATTAVLSEVQDSYAVAGYYYALAKDRKRRAKASGEKTFLDWQLYEDLLEAAVKALNSGLIVSQHLSKRERY